MKESNVILNGHQEISVNLNNSTAQKFELYWAITYVHSLGYNCGYILLPIDMPKNMIDKIRKDLLEEEYIEVHGGVTWNDELEFDKKFIHFRNGEKYVVFGWDYAHYGDWTTTNTDGEKHSINEIKNECINTINNIEKLLNS